MTWICTMFYQELKTLLQTEYCKHNIYWFVGVGFKAGTMITRLSVGDHNQGNTCILSIFLFFPHCRQHITRIVWKCVHVTLEQIQYTKYNLLWCFDFKTAVSQHSLCTHRRDIKLNKNKKLISYTKW